MFFNSDKIRWFYNNRIMPQAYDDSLSFQEAIYNCFNKINELVDKVNSWNELAKELDEALKEFDEKVKTEVKLIIQQMYEEGELEEIIKEVISDLPIENNSSILDFSRICRTITRSVPENDTTFETEEYSFPQGWTTFVIGGIRYWVLSLLPHNNYQANGKARINVYQQVTDNSLTLLDSYVFGGLGHANGMALHSTTETGFSVLITASEGDVLNNIIKIDFDITTGKLLTPTTTKTVVYDGINYVACITKFGAKWYLLCNNQRVYEYDFETNTVSKLICELNFNANISNAGIAVTNDFIFVANSIDNTIAKCDKNGAVKWLYKIPTVSNGGNNLFGEIENIVVENDEIFCVTGYSLNPKFYSNFVNVQFWKQNLKTNAIAPTNNLNGASVRNTVYVAGSVPTSVGNPSNPTGLTAESAFSSIAEAIDFGKWNTAFKTIRVNVLQPTNRSTIYIDTDKPVFISGEAYYSEHQSETNKVAYIGGIFANNGANLSIVDIGILSRFANISSVSSTIKNSCLYMLQGVLNLKNIYTPVGFNSNPSYITSAIVLNRGIGNFNYSDDFPVGTTEEQWNTREGHRNFFNAVDSMVNGHTRLTKNNSIIG